jgi:predicted flap endonuclease-1-like 5' DNA nuclease
VKKLLQLAVVAAIAKIAYDLVQKSQASTPLPDGAPYEPAPQPAAPPAASTPQDDDLTAVTGIGPVYAGKLRDMEITSFAALASADADSLAAGLDVSTAMVADWQSQARDKRS